MTVLIRIIAAAPCFFFFKSMGSSNQHFKMKTGLKIRALDFKFV